ncbi:MAG TPA: V-type ATP synthase subunit E [Candidatus Dormibacteraeota bacterium]|nr:V-type ATP synthase subunit E [Candidatus Dormibacteraeota bacterium]
MVASGGYTGEAERLAALLGEQAADEAAECLAAAREQAERTRASAQAEAESIRAAAEREGEARGQRRAAELLAVARAQRQMRLLQVREALIEAALTQARAQLAAALPAAAETLVALIREGLPHFPAGPVRVRIAERDAALLDPPLRAALEAGRWTLRVEPADVRGGGVILESDDGRLRFDNSLDARGRRRLDRLRRLAASILLLDTKEASGQP